MKQHPDNSKTARTVQHSVQYLPALNGSISTQSDIFDNCASVSPTKRGTLDRASVMRTPWVREGEWEYECEGG